MYLTYGGSRWLSTKNTRWNSSGELVCILNDFDLISDSYKHIRRSRDSWPSGVRSLLIQQRPLFSATPKPKVLLSV